MFAYSLQSLDANVEDEEDFSLKVLTKLPIRFWILCLITLFCYSTILVFMAFGVDMVHTKFGYDVRIFYVVPKLIIFRLAFLVIL